MVAGYEVVATEPPAACITLAVKQGMDAKVFSSLSGSLKFRWFSALGSVCRLAPTELTSNIRFHKKKADEAVRPIAIAYCNLIISLRLLALILCSNCSNTFNKVLSSM